MFTCSHCDAQSLKWAGRCTECGKWGTLLEGPGQQRSASQSTRSATGGTARKSAALSDEATAHAARMTTHIGELDRVLGGGVVAGSLVLLSGEPGIGKSTLVAMLARGFKGTNGTRKTDGTEDIDVLYVSGEESASQLSGRFARLGGAPTSLRFLEACPVEDLAATIEKEKPALAIIDSIQTLTASGVDGTAGSPTLVRYATSILMEAAKRTHVPLVLIGQVTKDGAVAGPKTLEHLVDVVLNLEGDPSHALRLLRASKNRFGATDEVGVFEMTSEGLTTVENPSAKFLEERASVPGSVITAAVEGTRVFLMEVQALVEKSAYGTPVRRASGFDNNRLQMLTAILSKRAGLQLGDQDVYVNVIGGMALREPAADLAVCAAIMSAHRGTALSPTVFVGEVGLGGEVRSVPLLDRRISEAKRMGVNAVVTPKTIKSIGELMR